jgi:long-subunit acyl-CoA synthetase (AMP-forming)
VALRVLNQHQQVVPIGVAGELFLGGDLLAKGYRNNADEIKHRFVSLEGENGRVERFYQTGDIVKFNHKGELMYLGRSDGQIKVRGFRVELGEIKAHLERMADVRQSVVLFEAERIIAYLQVVAPDSFDVGDVYSVLPRIMPSYIVPSEILVVSGIPVNNNGKVDYKALPGLVISKREHAQEQVVVDEKLLVIWKEVLNIDTIDFRRTFFEQGGNSITVIRLLNRINDTFDKKVELTDLFEHQSIMALSAFLTGTVGASTPTAPHKAIVKNMDKLRARHRDSSE